MNKLPDRSDAQKRVLIVDDENSVLDAVYELMESDGYEVLAARNGVDGLTIFHRSVHLIDLLVTDCNMPGGIGGLELAQACARRNRDVGVLYISGCRPCEELQADLDRPRRAYLSKPFCGNDLLRVARELLAPGFDRPTVIGPAPRRSAILLPRSA